MWGHTRSPGQGPGHTLHGRSLLHKREDMAFRDTGQGEKLLLRYGRSARDVCTAADRALPKGCDASPGTAARLPERKSLQQTPEEDTSKQDSTR